MMEDKFDLFLGIAFVLIALVSIVFVATTISQSMEDRLVIEGIAKCGFNVKCMPLVIIVMESANYNDKSDFRNEYYNTYTKGYEELKKQEGGE